MYHRGVEIFYKRMYPTMMKKIIKTNGHWKPDKEDTSMHINTTNKHDLSSEELGFNLEELCGQSLEFFVREGEKILLEGALEAEVRDVLDRYWYERIDRKEGEKGILMIESVAKFNAD
ncbi:MAG: hypothetical protein ACFFG0_19865 [Candidatus Thorarchaeota archaeon]